MKELRFRKNWIDEYEKLKTLIVGAFGEDGFRSLKKIISKLGTYHYNKKKYLLLGEERKFYNFLIENGYNPYRVYRWFLLERLPEDVRFQLKRGMISQKTASKLNFKRRHESKNQVCREIKIMAINLVRSM